ncbi:MAG: hypothetical protein MJ072_04500 [Clostridia bacterium]|nr:hypothetical protein [Clostridia bacterium]
MFLTEESKKRYGAFWNRTTTDRACLYLTAWDGSERFKEPSSPEQKWEDLDYREKRDLYGVEHTHYYADAFPSVFTNFGPGSLAAFIGGNYKPALNTVWFENSPLFVEEWEGRRKPAFDRKSKMYLLAEEYSARLLSHGDKFVTSIVDIGGTYDVIAALRGTENLLYDIIDNPEEIKKLHDEVAPLWKQYFLEQSSRLMEKQGCMSSWMPIWSDKTYYPLQCDYSALISPATFKEFVLPDLIYQTEYMERSVYHLDGVGEIPHLDHILSIPKLNAIQWVPGAGKPRESDPCWYELLNRIQAAGKGLVLLGVPTGDLEELFKHVSQKGLFVTANVRDEKEAKEITEMAKKLYF